MVDSVGFLDSVAGLPEQLASGHEVAGEIADGVELPAAASVKNIVLLGMGGSGIAGDVLATVTSGVLPVPAMVMKQIRTPQFVGPGTLAFALSYSGNTEETVSMARGALEAGATLVTVCSGGELATLPALVRYPCPPGLMPRAALGALVAPLFVTLFKMGLVPEAHALLVRAQQQLAKRRDKCVPAVEGDANPAREIARRIGRTIPLIHGGGHLGGVAAMRWKADVNENAKSPAFFSQHPELDHNEICGFGQHGDVTRQILTLVELRHSSEHARLAPRFDYVRGILEECVAGIVQVHAEGEGRLAQLLDLMYVGDWTSCYLALDNDVDPGPIDAIAGLKAVL